MKDIATNTTTSYILNKYKLHALKKYGQNFLIDPNIVNKIISSANVDKDSCVIEIGPGVGALTEILARNVGKVLCYEIDQRFKEVHQEFLNQDNIEMVYEDFLKTDIESLVKELKKNYKKVCIVANLPYYITTDIIEHVILSNCQIDSIIVMVQKEVALKMTGDYKNPLTIIIKDIGKIEYMFTVSKNVFTPSPRIDSAIIKITLEKEIDNKLYEVLKICFRQRRKTILNNLKAISNINPNEILDKCNISINKRSEELNLDDFKRITNYL